MPPIFGPLSAECPTLVGLSKVAALAKVRAQIRNSLRQIAPPRPSFHLPHKRNHDEVGPWLWLGTTGQIRDAGRWYQECKTCDDPVVLQFITDPLDLSLLTGKSALARLFDIYHEIQQYPDEPASRGTKRKYHQTTPSLAATRPVKRRRGGLAASPPSIRTQPAPFPCPSPLRGSFD